MDECNVRTLPPMKHRIKAALQFAGMTLTGHLVVKPREFVRFERRTASYPWLDHPSSRCRNWFPWRLDRTVTWSREVIVTLETTVHHSTSAPPKSHFEKTALCFANYPPRTTASIPRTPNKQQTMPRASRRRRRYAKTSVSDSNEIKSLATYHKYAGPRANYARPCIGGGDTGCLFNAIPPASTKHKNHYRWDDKPIT